MRLVSFGARGAERAGVLLGERVVPVAALDATLPGSVRGLLAADALPHLGRLVATTTAAGVPRAAVRLGPPVTDPGKIICIGLNYRGHAAEQNQPWPERPLLFSKTPNTLAGAADDIRLPVEDCGPDYEVELAVVIGRRAAGVTRDQALAHVAGYMVGNDVSARRWQRADGQWFRAKSCDTFYPCGPALVTADEVPELAALRLTTHLDDDLLQDATAAELIHDVPALIAFISRDITLEPGDIISTGTPAGVGCWRQPPRWLTPGATVRCAIDGLGELRNRVVAGPAAAG